jgi:hypothetical protein
MLLKLNLIETDLQISRKDPGLYQNNQVLVRLYGIEASSQSQARAHYHSLYQADVLAKSSLNYAGYLTAHSLV